MAKINIGHLKVDGVTFPLPSANGFKLSKNKVWSSNAGRTATAKFVGHIVANKRKLEITYNVLTQKQVEKISNVIDSTKSYHTVEYYDITKGQNQSFTGYCSDGVYPLYGFAQNGDVIVTGCSFSFVEQ